MAQNCVSDFTNLALPELSLYAMVNKRNPIPSRMIMNELIDGPLGDILASKKLPGDNLKETYNAVIAVCLELASNRPYITYPKLMYYKYPLDKPIRLYFSSNKMVWEHIGVLKYTIEREEKTLKRLLIARYYENEIVVEEYK